jgi:hypothetical protein
MNSTSRRWYWDALCAGAFFCQAIFLTRTLRGFPVAALIAFAIGISLAYVFGKSALRGLMGSLKTANTPSTTKK